MERADQSVNSTPSVSKSLPEEVEKHSLLNAQDALKQHVRTTRRIIDGKIYRIVSGALL